MSPDATGWSWKVDPQTRFLSPTFALDQSKPSYALQKAMADAYEDAGLVRGATSSWWDTPNTKKASSFANLFPSTENARTAIGAEREFARHWFPEFEHNKIHEVNANGIGDQSWAVQGGTDDAGFVAIGWTRDNATLSVYVTCNPCDSGLAEAGRRWARAIDNAARAAAD